MLKRVLSGLIGGIAGGIYQTLLGAATLVCFFFMMAKFPAVLSLSSPARISTLPDQ